MCTFFLIGITWLFKMTSNRRVCENCHIYEQYKPKQQCRNITKSILLAYKYYFDCKLGDQDKEWAPHVCCAPCNSMLSAWMNGKEKLCRSQSPWFDVIQKILSTIVIFVWQILFTKKNKSKITYPNCESPRKPVPHDKQIHHQFHHQIWVTPVPLKGLQWYGNRGRWHVCSGCR